MSSDLSLLGLISTKLSRLAHLFGYEDCQKSRGCFHPDVLCFLDVDVAAGFKGFCENVLLEFCHPSTGEDGTRYYYRIERDKDAIFYSERAVLVSGETSEIAGQALTCQRDSAEEARFIHRALAEIVEDVSTPLRLLRQTLQGSSLASEYAASFEAKIDSALLVD